MPAAVWGLDQLDTLQLQELGMDVVVTPAAHQLRRMCFLNLYGNTVTFEGTTQAATQVRGARALARACGRAGVAPQPRPLMPPLRQRVWVRAAPRVGVLPGRGRTGARRAAGPHPP